jgi:hypothetical protein
MANIIKIKALVALLAAAGAIFATASPALANDRGQCNGPNHRVVHKTTDLEVIVKSEGTKALAKLKTLARKHGWDERDGSLHSWLKDHTIIIRTNERIKITDYYCPRGSHTMKVWKVKWLDANTPLVVVLPSNIVKHDVSTTEKKGFEPKPLDLGPLALVLCSNGIEAALLRQSLFVRKGKEETKPVPEKPKPPVTNEQPKPQPPTGDCNGNNTGSGSVGSVTGNCSKQGDCNGVANCEVIIVTPPVEQPTSHTVQVSCVGFEEISGGGSFLVDCDVDNDNGKTITLIAHSNDANSRVSGINCYSQGGTASCTGKGTFEFRVSGINNTSNIVYSSVTVTASSNGVDKTFRSDPLPVDPACGGFGCGS